MGYDICDDTEFLNLTKAWVCKCNDSIDIEGMDFQLQMYYEYVMLFLRMYEILPKSVSRNGIVERHQKLDGFKANMLKQRECIDGA